jgi:PIN domain nuclease of toxin-antitoxin system
MIVTLDTNQIIKACKEQSWAHIDVLSLIRTGAHALGLDVEGKILAEYRQNCSGIELFEKWYAEMWQRVELKSGKLSKAHVAQLTSLGCHEPADHTFVAVAHQACHYLVTEDSDMAKGHVARSLANADVARYLRDTLKLTVHDAIEARNHLSGASQ